MTTALQIATVGAGYFSQFHYDGWSRLPVDLVGCCSLDEEARADVAAKYTIPATFSDFEAMLDETKPDLVDIITPPPTHKAFVTAAMARGMFKSSFTASRNLTWCSSLIMFSGSRAAAATCRT